MFGTSRQHYGTKTGISSGLLGISIGVTFSGNDANRIKRTLRALPEKVRRTVIQEELKTWAKETRQLVRAATPKGKTGRLRRDIITKVKSYAGGKVFWAAVGGRFLAQSKGRSRYVFGKDYLGAGWRLHFVTGNRRRRQAKGAASRPLWYRKRLKANGTVIVGSNFLERIGKVTRLRAANRIKLRLARLLNQ